MSKRKMITERIKGELGMTDDEVMHRRNANFRKDMDYVPNRLQDDPYTPNYSDKQEREAMYHTPEEMELKVAHDRMRAHKAGQRHKSDNIVHKVRFTESQVRSVIEESVKQMLSELDWKTYQNAAIKAQEFRDKNPYAYDRNRNFDFQHKAADEFYKKHGLEGQFDGPRYGGNKGTVNLNNSHLRNKDELEVTGSRDHNFGDENPHGLNHNVYHFGKKYGIDGGYGRTRMWDYAHDSTPEEFYGNKEMAQKFRNAEKDVEDYKSGKSKYIKGKGWQ